VDPDLANWLDEQQVPWYRVTNGKDPISRLPREWVIPKILDWMVRRPSKERGLFKHAGKEFWIESTTKSQDDENPEFTAKIHVIDHESSVVGNVDAHDWHKIKNYLDYHINFLGKKLNPNTQIF
jgi:hypothetical protein